jgi:ribosomal protein S18 acetylase RimI-like enzyme
LSTLLTVRSYHPNDVPRMAELITELNEREGYKQKMDAASLQKVFAPDAPVRVYAFVAESNGKVCGLLMYYDGYDTLTNSYGCHLMDMVVASSHRRQGMGDTLIRMLVAQVLELNYQWISLTVLKKNSEAQAFYKALGFEEVAVDFFAIGHSAMQRLLHG